MSYMRDLSSANTSNTVREYAATKLFDKNTTTYLVQDERGEPLSTSLAENAEVDLYVHSYF